MSRDVQKLMFVLCLVLGAVHVIDIVYGYANNYSQDYFRAAARAASMFVLSAVYLNFLRQAKRLESHGSQVSGRVPPAGSAIPIWVRMGLGYVMARKPSMRTLWMLSALAALWTLSSEGPIERTFAVAIAACVIWHLLSVSWMDRKSMWHG